MSDLISRQAAIDALMVRDKELRNINWYDKPYAEGECRGIDEALAIVSNLPSAQPERTENARGTHACDLIDRQALMKEFSDFVRASNNSDFARTPTWNDAVSLVGSMPSAQPEQQHGRIFQEIVVEYPSYNIYPGCKGSPYFSIKYTENGQEFIGYGTYKPEVLSEYLKEYFMPSAQPQITHCAECIHWKHSDVRKNYCEVFDWVNKAEDFCSFAERKDTE